MSNTDVPVHEDTLSVNYTQNLDSKPGPKCKYEYWMCAKIKEIAGSGGHIPAMCRAIGINSEDTFHRWKREIPEFKEAYEEAKMISKSVYENILLQGAMGQIPHFNFNSVAMIMNNKFPDEYKRGANGSNTNTEITINQLNLTPEQIDYKIQALLEKRRARGIDIIEPEYLIEDLSNE